jgi:glycosyltransferase involved in cell wall biosynthesis
VFGGGEYIFYLLARELAKRGHNVQVIAQRLANSSEFEIFEGIKIHRVGTELSYSGTLPQTIRHNLAYFIHSVTKAREIINDTRPDILHSNTYVPSLSGQACSTLYRIPHIVTFHDVYQASDNQFWSNWYAGQRRGIPIYTALLSKLVEKCVMKLDVAVFHTVSEASKTDLIKFGVKKEIRVIPNGIDRTLYGSADPTCTSLLDSPTVVFIGRLVFYKNVETVIRAFRKVIQKFPNARLIIIGDGPHKDSLIIEASEIKESVSFVGRISHQEKLTYIQRASCVVFPSLIEGFGIAAIEGFACRKPVLVSDVRPLSDIVINNKTGYIISPFDVDTWSEKIIDLLSDTEKQRTMGENAFREFLLHYEIGKVASSMESLYFYSISK